jgi:hypothetical protein
MIDVTPIFCWVGCQYSNETVFLIELYTLYCTCMVHLRASFVYCSAVTICWEAAVVNNGLTWKTLLTMEKLTNRSYPCHGDVSSILLISPICCLARYDLRCRKGCKTPFIHSFMHSFAPGKNTSSFMKFLSFRSVGFENTCGDRTEWSRCLDPCT